MKASRPSASPASPSRRTASRSSGFARSSVATSCPTTTSPARSRSSLIGHGVWQNRYGSNPSAIGRTVRINDVPAVIIGVMPDGFKFPQNADLWQPLLTTPNLETQKRNQRPLQVFGRLAPGVTREQAQGEMISITQQLEKQNPDTNKDIQATVQTFNENMNGGPIRTVFLSLMGAVAFVLLIACANVANLLLSRATNRAREIAVRISIGASRWRVVRQLLIESVLLAVISGLAGLGIAAIGIRIFDRATQEVGRPYWIQFTIDANVFAFFAAVCLGTGIIFGLAPALHVSKTDVNEILKEGGRSGSAGVRARRWTGVLMVAELTLTVVLLAGAGFMMRNFVTMYRLDLGVDTSQAPDDGAGVARAEVSSRRTTPRVLRAAPGAPEVQPSHRKRHHHQQRADAGRLPARASPSTASRSTRASRRPT